MKLHNLNIFLLLITIILIALNTFRFYEYRSWDREYYTYVIGVPDLYPVEISATITTRNGESFLIYKPDGSWGRAFVRDDQLKYISLPDSLHIKWLSLRERKVFEGAFKFPSGKIDSIFQTKNSNKKVFERYSKSSRKGYNFSMGISTEGTITIWIEGNDDYQKEIATFKAKKTNEWNDLSGQELVNYIINEPDLNGRPKESKLEDILHNNVPPDLKKWRSIQKKYTYYIWLDPNLSISKLNYFTFNEEKGILDFSSKNKILVKTGAPKLFISNKFSDGSHFSFRYKDSIILPAFKKESLKLLPSDTLVIFIQKSLKTHLINTQEVDSLLTTY